MNDIVHVMASSKRAIPCLFYPVVKELGMSVYDALTDSMKQRDVLLKIAEVKIPPDFRQALRCIVYTPE